MRLSDGAAGLLILVSGVAVVAYAQTFPPMPGQDVGPSFFPTWVGAGLAIAGSLLISAHVRSPHNPWVQLDDWVRAPRRALTFGLVVADLAFYAVTVDHLGFFLTAFVFLTVLLLAFGRRGASALAIAALATFAIHYAFYTVLRVPLPWGVLRGIAW